MMLIFLVRVLVLVRQHVLQLMVVLPSQRILLRHIHGFLPGGILCGSIYLPLQRGATGTGEHLESILLLGGFLAKWGRPFIIGGDWNCTPQEAVATGAPARL